MSVFGDRLIEARKRQGLTQSELADKAGITRSGVGGYEREGKDASYEVLTRLVRALGVSADYLIGIDDNAGWKNRAHIAETFYNLELYYDRATDAQKAAIDALLVEVDKYLVQLLERPDAAKLALLSDIVKSARKLNGDDDDE